MELKRRQKEEKIRYWKPHPKQLDAVRSKAKIRLVLGGNRSGKSEWGVIEAISHALGYRPYLKQDDPDYLVDVKIPSRGRICGEDYRNHIGNIIIPKLREWIPKGEIAEIKKNPQGVEILWVLKNGSTLELMTYEQESDKFEGADSDWVWFDEPPPRAIFIASYRGLVDRNGKCWFSMTPLKEPWIKNELWDKQKDTNASIDGFIFDILDNVGFGLTKKAVIKFEEMLTPEEKESRLRGKFMHLAGLVYKEFDYSVHAIKPFEIPLDWPIYLAIDPHPRTPHAVLFMAVSPDGTKYIFDELFRACLVEELAQYIKAKLNGRKPRMVLIDPASGIPNPISGGNFQTELAKHGIFTVKASKELSLGITRVKRALTPKFNGTPEIFFFNTLKETFYEFSNYVWDDYKGKSQTERNPKNAPRDKDDHMMECLYRLLLSEPKYRAPNFSYDYYEQDNKTNKFTGW